jgi:hypothetical protein
VLTFVVAAVGAGAAAVGALLVRELRLARRERLVAGLLATFAPAIARVREDARELLVWHPLAEAARRLYPAAFAAIDRARGQRFPFAAADVQAAHDRWTAEWLAWERAHDFEYKLKATEAERDLRADPTSDVLRGRVQAVERAKLELYQRRYEEYIRVAKAIQGLDSPQSVSSSSS